MTRLFPLLVAALLCAVPAAAAPGAPVDDSARLLAGMVPADPASPAMALTRNAAWQGLRTRADKSWQAYVQDDMGAIQAWSREQLADAPGGTVFYPFSGPDILNALNFVPQGRTYILLGLEPVGAIPAFGPGDAPALTSSMGAAMSALDEILGINFFLTNGMREEVGKHPFAGIAGIMSWFLVRTDHELLSARLVDVTADGALVAGKGGVEIVFRKRGSREERKAYYFSGDISDGGLAARPGLVRFLEAQGELTTYLKAASYLMFRSAFDDVRSLILDRSRAIVTDDAGMPWRYFGEKGFETRLYGDYSDPIKLFALRCQPDLKAAYAKGPVRGPLGFDFGYTYWHPHLVYAVRPAGLPIAMPVYDGTAAVGDDTWCDAASGRLMTKRTPRKK
jgi:hypothetical protein